MGKLNIKDMQSIAQNRDGKCLSTSYINQNSKLKWECGECGNIWDTTYASISIGGWCPECGKERSRRSKIKYTIQDMRDIANDHGGKCLSEKYISSSHKLSWQCKSGHVWDALPYGVIHGSWCKICAFKNSGKSQRLSIRWFKEYAEKRDGKCLTNEYNNAWSLLTFQCSKGHQWTTDARNIRRGSWCHLCGGSAPLDIEVFKTIAKERGGECLTKSYKNQRQKLEFKCENGHIFKKDAAAVKNTTQWCPVCTQHIGERFCNVAFETIFKVKFEKTWPEWLRNSRNQPMELDGYNPSLQIAFEHQGEQHYSINTHWITTEEQLRLRKKDDQRKYYLARKNSVHLFRVPQVPQRISPEKLIRYIVNKARKRGIEVPSGWEALTIDYKKVYHGHAKERINICMSLALEKGGEFLSEEWKGEEYKYRWRCSANHEWATKLRYIQRGNWCKYCSGMARHTIEVFQKIAKENGGECLSREYISGKKLLKFQCKEGHVFYSSGSNVKNHGRWCSKCSGKKKLTINEMRDLARKKNGKCLSGQYINNKTKLLWECEKGHQWEASPKKIKIGQWCPKCARRKKSI